MLKKRLMAAGTFKAECLAVLDRVAETGETVVVTKRGRPVAEVVPVRTRTSRPLHRSVTTHGDIVGPVLGDWDLDR
jgi:prevent-host-death family protein